MISALNLRQPLSGNKITWFCLLLIAAMWSCTSPRQAAGEQKPPAVSHQDEQPAPVDQGHDEVQPRDAVIVDTVRWMEDNVAPVLIDPSETPVKTSPKGKYDIALLMPFNAGGAPLFSESQDPRLNRFVQYYAGVRMALHEIDSMKWPVTTYTYDAEGSPDAVSKLTQDEGVKNADIIVGPYEKKDIETVAAYGLAHKKFVVSPWLPSFNTESANPYLIQLSPALSSHALVITEFIRDEMPGKKVYVVTRDNATERNRVQLFSKDSLLKVEELLIKDVSPELVNTDLHAKLSDDRGTVFILPYFSKNDEAFVSAFMRKLHAEKDTREAIVFGLPQWIGFSNLNPNYMESLSLHLSISSFIDIASPGYQSFRNRFFHTYHTVPDLNAFLGYDLMKWMASSLTSGGTDALTAHPPDETYGLSSGFDIQPVYKATGASGEKLTTPMYYENRKIRILRFLDQDFILAR